MQVREKLEHQVQAPVMRKNGKQKGTMALHLKFAPNGGKVGSSRGSGALAGSRCWGLLAMIQAWGTVQRAAMPGKARTSTGMVHHGRAQHMWARRHELRCLNLGATATASNWPAAKLQSNRC